MIEIIDSKEIKSVDDVDTIQCEKESKALMILDLSSGLDLANLKGSIYAISDSIDTFDELCEIKHSIEETGKLCIIVGSYGGMDIGVQYEIRK